MEEETLAAFSRLLSLIKTLCSEDGCPWDKEQTPLTMRRFLVEEAFEAVDAISEENSTHAREELGDVLFNTLMTSYLYEKQGDFTVAAVCNHIVDKMILRHPHVFPESAGKSEMHVPVQSASEVKTQWERIKEKVEGRAKDSPLDEVPAGFPPLLKADKLLKKAEGEGFVWSSEQDAVSKVNEELSEIEAAFADVRRISKEAQSSAKTKETAQLHLEEEVGDLLLASVTLSRSLGVNAVVALERADKKFYDRFTFVERKMKEHGIPLDKDHCADMERFWKDAKKREENP